MTIQELIDKLNLVVSKGWVDKGDIVFIALSDETEDYYPIENITGNPIQFLEGDEEELEEWKNRRKCNISFVKPKTRTI